MVDTVHSNNPSPGLEKKEVDTRLQSGASQELAVRVGLRL